MTQSIGNYQYRRPICLLQLKWLWFKICIWQHYNVTEFRKNVPGLFVFYVPAYDLSNKDHDKKCRNVFSRAIRLNLIHQFVFVCFTHKIEIHQILSIVAYSEFNKVK